MEDDLIRIRSRTAFIIDMDGVVYHGDRLLRGAAELVGWLRSEGKRFLFLTNSSERSPIELSQKLGRLGIEVESEHFYTSVLATAGFLAAQKPGGSAYVIGEPGLINALYYAGYPMKTMSIPTTSWWAKGGATVSRRWRRPYVSCTREPS